MEETSWETKRNEKSNGEGKRNSRISEWLKPEPEPEIKEDSNNKKYIVIAGMIILACLAWYYFDDIKPVGTSVLETIRSFRPRPDDDSNNNSGNIQSNNSMNLKSRLKNLFNKEDKSQNLSTHFDNSSQSTVTPIKLGDETPIASTSKLKLDDANSSSGETIDDYFTKGKNKTVSFDDQLLST